MALEWAGMVQLVPLGVPGEQLCASSRLLS